MEPFLPQYAVIPAQIQGVRRLRDYKAWAFRNVTSVERDALGNATIASCGSPKLRSAAISTVSAT
jgi:hypothetical protein